MPRDGSGVFSADWVNASPNTTIESAKQNAMIADLVADANAARPITAGGTGGNTAAAARTALAVPGLATENVFTKTQIWAKGADVASAAALPIIDDGNYFDVTGTTTVTSIATVGVGAVIKLHFDGALILTHHATDLILPGAANITTAAGDEAEFFEYATGDWRCLSYTRAAAAPVVTGTFTPTLTCGTSGTITLNAGSILGYVKIGSVVTISGLLTVSSVSSPSGTLTLGTLPFASVNANRGYATAPIWVSDFVGTAGVVWQAFISLNSTTASIGFYSQATGTTGANPSVLIQAGTVIVFNATYLTA